MQCEWMTTNYLKRCCGQTLEVNEDVVDRSQYALTGWNKTQWNWFVEIGGRIPRIEVAGDICLRRPRPIQGCTADDDDDELFGSSWPFGWTLCATYFYGLKFSLSCQIHKINYVLILYMYINKYAAQNIRFWRIFFFTYSCQCSLLSKKIQLSGFCAYLDCSPSQLIRISEVLLYNLLTYLLHTAESFLRS